MPIISTQPGSTVFAAGKSIGQISREKEEYTRGVEQARIDMQQQQIDDARKARQMANMLAEKQMAMQEIMAQQAREAQQARDIYSAGQAKERAIIGEAGATARTEAGIAGRMEQAELAETGRVEEREASREEREGLRKKAKEKELGKIDAEDTTFMNEMRRKGEIISYGDVAEEVPSDIQEELKDAGAVWQKLPSGKGVWWMPKEKKTGRQTIEGKIKEKETALGRKFTTAEREREVKKGETWAEIDARRERTLQKKEEKARKKDEETQRKIVENAEKRVLGQIFKPVTYEGVNIGAPDNYLVWSRFLDLAPKMQGTGINLDAIADKIAQQFGLPTDPDMEQQVLSIATPHTSGKSKSGSKYKILDVG